MEKEKIEVCVPLNLRKENVVDKLLKRAREIQDSCKHDFRLESQPIFAKSKTDGVYIFRQNLTWNKAFLILRCLNCSLGKSTDIFETCSRCLGKMKRKIGLEARGKYFNGEPSHFLMAEIYYCEFCDFKIVNDRWEPED